MSKAIVELPWMPNWRDDGDSLDGYASVARPEEELRCNHYSWLIQCSSRLLTGSY